jgi:T-complex protein 1 subunit delta
LDAIKSICNINTATNVDLNNIKVYQKLGGTMDDIQLFKGIVFPTKGPINAPGAPTKVLNPKIAVLQFCISSPKTNMENNVVVSDYAQIDQILKEERQYIMKIVKQIVKAGANVILLQKSILRDAINDLAIHFLSK